MRFIMKAIVYFAFCLLFLSLTACVNPRNDKSGDSEVKDTAKTEQDTVFEGEEIPENNRKVNVTQPGAAQKDPRYVNNKGIGPITEVVLLNEIDEQMVKEGKKLFNKVMLYNVVESLILHTSSR